MRQERLRISTSASTDQAAPSIRCRSLPIAHKRKLQNENYPQIDADQNGPISSAPNVRHASACRRVYRTPTFGPRNSDKLKHVGHQERATCFSLSPGLHNTNLQVPRNSDKLKHVGHQERPTCDMLQLLSPSLHNTNLQLVFWSTTNPGSAASQNSPDDNAASTFVFRAAD